MWFKHNIISSNQVDEYNCIKNKTQVKCPQHQQILMYSNSFNVFVHQKYRTNLRMRIYRTAIFNANIF